jgi:hypothetical protein
MINLVDRVIHEKGRDDSEVNFFVSDAYHDHYSEFEFVLGEIREAVYWCLHDDEDIKS